MSKPLLYYEKIRNFATEIKGKPTTIEIMNETIISRETANGTKWQIIADKYGAALYMQDFGKEGYHFSGYYFNSVEQANAHLDAVDERVRAPRMASAALDCSSFYGRGSNVYYGD